MTTTTDIDPLAVHWSREKVLRARDLSRALQSAASALADADRLVRASLLSDSGVDPADFGDADADDALAHLRDAGRAVRAVQRIAEGAELAAEEAWQQATVPQIKEAGIGD